MAIDFESTRIPVTLSADAIIDSNDKVMMLADERTIVDTAANLDSLNPTLATGQFAIASDTGLRKIGPGAYNSLPYMPRRWSAAATNLLAITNGDGAEKTVGSIVIPAHTLAVDGDRIHITFVAGYLNNTGAGQVPQFGLSLNAAANLYLSSASGQSVVSNGYWYGACNDVFILRKSASTICVDHRVALYAGPGTPGGASPSHGDLSFVQPAPRRQLKDGVTFDCAAQNTVNFKMLILAYGTPALHQIAGSTGSAALNG